MVRLLRVDARSRKDPRGFVAGMEWVKGSDGKWRPGRCAPVLMWMTRQHPKRIRDFLERAARREGWTYEWLGPF